MPYGALPAAAGVGRRRAGGDAGAAAAAARRAARDRDLPPAAVPARPRADRPAPGRRALVLALGPLRGRLRRRPRASASGCEDLHLAASLRAAVNVVVSDALGELAREEGARAAAGAARRRLVPRARPRRATVVAVSLGHLGHRTDWALLRAVAEGDAGAVLLLIGEWHEDESGRDADFQACRARAQPRLARPPLRRGGGAADPAAPTSGSSRSSARSSTTPRCPTGSSSTPGSAGARSRRTCKGVRTWDRAVTIADGAGGVDRRAARAGRRAHAPGPRAARVGARPDRARSRTGRCGSAWRRSGIESGRLGLGARSAAADTRSEGHAAATGAKPGTRAG